MEKFLPPVGFILWM